MTTSNTQKQDLFSLVDNPEQYLAIENHIAGCKNTTIEDEDIIRSKTLIFKDVKKIQGSMKTDVLKQ